MTARKVPVQYVFHNPVSNQLYFLHSSSFEQMLIRSTAVSPCLVNKFPSKIFPQIPQEL